MLATLRRPGLNICPVHVGMVKPIQEGEGGRLRSLSTVRAQARGRSSAPAARLPRTLTVALRALPLIYVAASPLITQTKETSDERYTAEQQ